MICGPVPQDAAERQAMEQNSYKPIVHRRSGIGTGTISLLMIFTVLCFATLAIISLTTAFSSRNTQLRGLEGSAAVAAAKGTAAEKVAELDAELAPLHALHSDPLVALDIDKPYLQQAGEMAEAQGWSYDAEAGTISLTLPVEGTGNELVTVLELQDAGAAARYTLARQATQPVGGWQPEGEGQLLMP